MYTNTHKIYFFPTPVTSKKPLPWKSNMFPKQTWRERFPLEMVHTWPRKVDSRLPGKGNSNSHGVRPVY